MAMLLSFQHPQTAVLSIKYHQPAMLSLQYPCPAVAYNELRTIKSLATLLVIITGYSLIFFIPKRLAIQGD
jgi:hypothetical protein